MQPRTPSRYAKENPVQPALGLCAQPCGIGVAQPLTQLGGEACALKKRSEPLGPPAAKHPAHDQQQAEPPIMTQMFFNALCKKATTSISRIPLDSGLCPNVHSLTQSARGD